jgi:hypothetical protein
MDKSNQSKFGNIYDMALYLIDFVYKSRGLPVVIDGWNIRRKNNIDSCDEKEILDDVINSAIKFANNKHTSNILVYKNAEGNEVHDDDYYKMLQITKERKDTIILYAIWNEIVKRPNETATEFKSRIKSEHSDKINMYSRDDIAIVVFYDIFKAITDAAVLFSYDKFRNINSFKNIQPFELYMLVGGLSYPFIFDISKVNIYRLQQVVKIYKKRIGQLNEISSTIRGNPLIKYANNCPHCGKTIEYSLITSRF